jgi:hypothetical protein
MSDEADRPRAAAIDIGTNSIKMTVAAADGADGIAQLDWATEPVRLGQGLDQTGKLDEARIDAAIATLQRFEARARELGAARVVAVATEAARAAANGEAFLDRVRAETGVEVAVIGGQEEAALTFRGLAIASDLSGTVVVADIGGGSTEIIVARDGGILEAESLTLGSGRLTDRLIASDPPTPEELAACEAEAAGILGARAGSPSLPAGDGVRLLVLGGTGEYLERLVGPGREIDLPTVRDTLATLSTTPAAEVATMLDIPEARARVLPAGVAIVAALIDRIQPAAVEIARSGIRAGLLLDLFARRETPVEAKDDAAHHPTYREAMRSLIAARWKVVWRTIPAAIEGSDIEAVHDVRVASRRLRAAMDVGAGCFPAKWFKPLHRAAKEITGALGEVRDRDVLLEALHAARAAAPLVEQPGIDRLIARVEGERTAARAGMEAYLRALLDGPLPAQTERRFGGSPEPNDQQSPKARAT